MQEALHNDDGDRQQRPKCGVPGMFRFTLYSLKAQMHLSSELVDFMRKQKKMGKPALCSSEQDSNRGVGFGAAGGGQGFGSVSSTGV